MAATRHATSRAASASAPVLEAVRGIAAAINPDRFEAILRDGHVLKTTGIDLDRLSEVDAAKVARAASHVKTAVAIVVFVVGCFITEAIPLPMVAFCIGVIAMLLKLFSLGGVVVGPMIGIIGEAIIAELVLSLGGQPRRLIAARREVTNANGT